MAQDIHDKARQLQNEGRLDHPVLVITLLCSAQQKVQEIYGSELAQRSIPVLHKSSEVALCGFYIGAVLEGYRTQPEKEIPTFDRWLMETNLGFLRENKNYEAALSINGKIMVYSTDGSCYTPLLDFIRVNMDKISDHLNREGNPQYIPLLERAVNPPMRRGIESKL